MTYIYPCDRGTELLARCCPDGWRTSAALFAPLSPCFRPPRRYRARATVPFASVSFGQIVLPEPRVARIPLVRRSGLFQNLSVLLHRLSWNTGRVFGVATGVRSSSTRTLLQGWWAHRALIWLNSLANEHRCSDGERFVVVGVLLSGAKLLRSGASVCVGIKRSNQTIMSC